MDDAWFSREVPILEAVIDLLEEGSPDELVNVTAIARRANLDEASVRRGLRGLNHDHLDVQIMGDSMVVRDVRPEGRRAVGQWPSPERIAARVVAGLEAAAEKEPDGDKKKKLKQAGSFFRSAGKDLFVDVIAAVITRGTGLG